MSQRSNLYIGEGTILINISGTNGSGKSTIVRVILEAGAPAKAIYGVLGIKQPEAYALNVNLVQHPLYILGPYRTPTGGADQIQPFDLIPQLLEKYVARGHILFEGLLCSGAFGQVRKTMERWGKNSVVAIMDTPLEVCIKNTQARRDVRGTTRPLNPTNMTTKYKSLQTGRKRIIADNIMTVIDLPYENGAAIILKMLREAR